MSGTMASANPVTHADRVLDLLVEGPEAAGVSDADLRRFFPGSTLTGVRLNRLRNWPRIVVRLDGARVGVATFTQTHGETHIPDFAVHLASGIRSDRSCLERRVLYALLDAIDLASKAGGCHRIVLIRSGVAAADLERRGYERINEGCAGAWMEKSLL